MRRASWLCIALLFWAAPDRAQATLRSDRFGAPASVRVAGPPPLAPVHGQRHEHASGVQLHFDAELGAYVVADSDALYFFRGSFLRLHRGDWQSSRSTRGPWRTLRVEWIPFTLRLKHYAPAR